MKLQVSAELCRGHGRCYTVAPDLLEDDEDEGFVTARGQIVDVPEDQVDAARNAAGSCPERAITLLED
jgi:ferredoxin